MNKAFTAFRSTSNKSCYPPFTESSNNNTPEAQENVYLLCRNDEAFLLPLSSSFFMNINDHIFVTRFYSRSQKEFLQPLHRGEFKVAPDLKANGYRLNSARFVDETKSIGLSTAHYKSWLVFQGLQTSLTDFSLMSRQYFEHY